MQTGLLYKLNDNTGPFARLALTTGTNRKHDDEPDFRGI